MITRWRYFRCSVMFTRWRYCLVASRVASVITRRHYYIIAVIITSLSAAMITRWHYFISVEMVTGWVHWIVNVSFCKDLWIARRKHQHLQPAAGKRPLIRKTGWGTTERERDRDREEREMDRKREKEGEKIQCFMKKGGLKPDRLRKC